MKYICLGSQRNGLMDECFAYDNVLRGSTPAGADVRPSRARAACRRSVPTRPRESKRGTLALGHPFAATGARILSQAVKELAAICTCEPFMHRTDGNAGIRALAPAWISSLDLEVALG